jgi:alanine-glyoxylate transaminase/serine-glyoxylate transaminase/serine-pyruvate transaminase
MADIAGRAGGKVTVLDAKWGEGFEPGQVEPLLKGKNVKVLAIVQAETSTGYNQPVKEFAELAHKHGALIVVDAVTSTGGIPVEVDAWGIDAIYTGTQKCLGGPPGLAPISFSPRAVEKLDKRKSKVQSWYLDMTLVRKYWGADRAYHHTAPINNVYGLHESLRIVLDEGLEARWKRHQEAHERFARGGGARPRLPGEGRPAPAAAQRGEDPRRLRGQAGPQGAPREARDRDRRRPGDLAGKVWRIGLMGYGARPEVVDQMLTASRRSSRNDVDATGVHRGRSGPGWPRAARRRRPRRAGRRTRCRSWTPTSTASPVRRSAFPLPSRRAVQAGDAGAARPAPPCMDGAGVDYAIVVHPEPYQDNHDYLEHCLDVGKGKLKGTCPLLRGRPGALDQMAALVKRGPARSSRRGSTPTRPSGCRPFGKPELRELWKKAADSGLMIQLHFEPRYAPASSR